MFPVTVADGRISVDVPERGSAPQVAQPTAS
jgi:hypothetical protein